MDALHWRSSRYFGLCTRYVRYMHIVLRDDATEHWIDTLPVKNMATSKTIV